MLVLDYSDKLVHEVTGHTIQNSFKERLVVVQSESQLELELETAPDSMIRALLRRRTAQHLGPQELVKLMRILPVLAQSVDFDEALTRDASLRNEELIGLLRVVNLILVGQVHQKVKARTGCEMCVVNCWLWHLLKALVEGRINQLVKLVIILANYKCMVGLNHLLSQSVEFVVYNSTLVRKRNFVSCVV